VVGLYTDFDVARAVDRRLDQQTPVPAPAEGRRLGAARGENGAQVGAAVVDAPRAAAAAAAARLDEGRALAPHERGGGRRVRDDRAGRDGHAGGLGDAARRDLVAPERQRVRRRSHEREAARADRGRERCRLGEESVARVHRVRAAFLRGRDERGALVVARDRGDGVRAVARRQRLVAWRAHSHGRKEPVPRAPHDARSDLAAIRHEQALEAPHRAGASRGRRARRRRRGAPTPPRESTRAVSILLHHELQFNLQERKLPRDP